MMTTRATVEGVRVTVWQAHMLSGWYWSTDPKEGRVYGEFPTLELAIEDAKRVHPGIPIGRHTDAAPRAEGGGV